MSLKLLLAAMRLKMSEHVFFHALTQCSLLIFCDSRFCSYCFHVILAMILGFAEGVRSAEEALAVATKACVVCDVNDMPPEMESCKEPLELPSILLA